jgi:hypothetical protein
MLPLVSNLIVAKWFTVVFGVILILIESLVSVLYLYDNTYRFYKLFGVFMVVSVVIIRALGIAYSIKWLRMEKIPEQNNFKG